MSSTLWGKHKHPTETMHHIDQSSYLLAQTNLLLNTIFGVNVVRLKLEQPTALHSLVNTSASVWEVSCHMLCVQHWGTYFAHPQFKTGGESQDFPNQMTECTMYLPCDKCVTRYVCCFGFWGGWHFVAGRGKEKVLHIPPTPPKKCAEKLLRVRAVERQTCITTTIRHAVTQVGSPQLLSGRQMSAVLYLIWITRAQSGNCFPNLAHRQTVLVTHYDSVATLAT